MALSLRFLLFMLVISWERISVSLTISIKDSPEETTIPTQTAEGMSGGFTTSKNDSTEESTIPTHTAVAGQCNKSCNHCHKNSECILDRIKCKTHCLCPSSSILHDFIGENCEKKIAWKFLTILVAGVAGLVILILISVVICQCRKTNHITNKNLKTGEEEEKYSSSSVDFRLAGLKDKMNGRDIKRNNIQSGSGIHNYRPRMAAENPVMFNELSRQEIIMHGDARQHPRYPALYREGSRGVRNDSNHEDNRRLHDEEIYQGHRKRDYQGHERIGRWTQGHADDYQVHLGIESVSIDGIGYCMNATGHVIKLNEVL